MGRTWRLSTPSRELEVSIVSSGVARRDRDALREEVAFFGRAAIRAREPEALAFARQLADPFGDRADERLSIDELESRFESAVFRGRVACTQRPRAAGSALGTARPRAEAPRAPERIEPRPSPERTPPAPVPREEEAWIAIELVDELGEPVPHVAYRVEDSTGVVRTGNTGSTGRARVTGIRAGQCRVSFPEIDGREWDAA